MKNFFSGIGLILSLSLLTHQAIANNNGFYLKAYGGVSFSCSENFQVYGTEGFPDPEKDFSKRIGNSVLLGGGIGYQFNPYLRTDITFDARPNFSYDKTFTNPGRHRTFDIRNLATMANLYLDLKQLLNTGAFNPYIGAGIGTAFNRTKNYTVANTGTPVKNHLATYDNVALAWQIIVGANIDLMKNFLLDFGYRHVNLGQIKVSTHSTTEPWLKIARLRTGGYAGANELYIGLRYNFFQDN